MKYFYDTFNTSVGELSVAVDETGAVVAMLAGGTPAMENYIGESPLTHDADATREAREQVLAYFDGERKEFTLPLAPAGTPFQKLVWAALLRIPYGKTRSYGEIAADVGKPTASRAVGRANGTNPICIIVPCHRVIGADGSLTGYAYGEEMKRRLLELEGALRAAPEFHLA